MFKNMPYLIMGIPLGTQLKAHITNNFFFKKFKNYGVCWHQALCGS